jgi:ParB-like chromosome segregation protein Spo0J
MFRDRIKSLRRVRAGDLRQNPDNWRTHPESQREALRGVLEEVGLVDACIARELPDGTLELLDGHLRADMDPEQKIPVLVVTLDDAEAKKVLATLDPLAAMAEADAAKLDSLLREIDTGSEELSKMLAELAEENGVVPPDDTGEESDQDELMPAERWGVYVECKDETAQCSLLERLSAEGYECRGMTV